MRSFSVTGHHHPTQFLVVVAMIGIVLAGAVAPLWDTVIALAVDHAGLPRVMATAMALLIVLMLGFTGLVLAGRRHVAVAGRSHNSAPENSAGAAEPPPTGVPALVSDILNETVRNFSIIFSKTWQIADQLKNYHSFTEVLRGQMDGIAGETEQAALNILTRLQAVDQSIGDMLAFLAQSGSNDRVVTIIDRTEGQMAENRRLIAHFLDQGQKDEEESRQHMAGIGDRIQQLTSVVQTVRSLAHQTNMLAFNATIEAEHAGQYGKGFAIVAAEVKALARQSDKAAVDIQRGIEQLQATISTGLRAMVNERIERQRQGLESVARTVSELTENLEKLISHQRDVLAKVEVESQRIATPIMELIGSIQFQDITRQQLHHVGDALQTLDEHTGTMNEAMRNFSQDLSIGSIDEKIMRIFDDYVMAQQRNRHREAIGGDETAPAEDPGQAIELF